MKQKNNDKFSFFNDISLVISNPAEFFTKINKYNEIKRIIEFCFIFIFLIVVTNMVFRLTDITQGLINISPVQYILFVFVLVLFVLLLIITITLLSIVFYFIYHVLARMLHAKGNFLQSYKMLYSKTPIFIAFLIPFNSQFKIIFWPMLAVGIVDSLYIEFSGLIKLHKMSKENAITLMFLGFILQAIFALILVLIEMFLNS